MKYYKILNNELIGVVSSKNFIKYSPIANYFLRSDEQNGEYINLDGTLYRATWMAPIVKQEPYISAIVVEISEEEYNIYANAIINNETIEIVPQEPIPNTEEEINPIDVESLEFIRSSKLTEMSYACRTTIEAGFDLELRNGIHHFSLDTQDQLNLISLGEMAKTQSLIPYHADREECEFYTPEEIKEIIAAATNFKNYQIAYHNALKAYINALDTIEAIAAIEYGTPIPDEYKSDVLRVLE